jgi:hypothetical protein
MNKIFILILLLFSCLLFSDITTIDLNEIEKQAEKALLEKDFNQASRLFLQYLQYDIRNGRIAYNLACSFALAGNDSLAVKYLKHAFKNGFDNLDHLKSDPDFDKIRTRPNFLDLMTELNRKSHLP